MSLAREQINHGLPSIDLGSSKRELFLNFLTIQHAKESLPGSFGSHHDNFRHIELAVDSGLVFPLVNIDEAVEELLHQNPQELFIPLYQMWYSLQVQHMSKHRPQLKETWYESLNQIQNPFVRARHTVEWYTSTTQNQLDKQAIRTYLQINLDQLRSLLPSYEEARRLFDYHTTAGETFFGKKTLSDITAFLRLVQSVGLGDDIEDIDTYIVGLLEGLTIEKTDSRTLETLVGYTAESTIHPEVDRIATLFRVLVHIKSHPQQETQESVLKALTKAYLKKNYIPQAMRAWTYIKSYQSSLSSIEHAVENAAAHNQLHIIRSQWEPYLVNKPNAPKEIGYHSAHFRDIRILWFRAGCSLEKQRISLLQEPELLQFLDDVGIETYLPDAVRLTRQFPQAQKFREKLKQRLVSTLLAYNNGNLSDSAAAALFESILLFK